MNIYIVDAFTDTPFTGNPAGVCVLDAPIPDKVMKQIAQEVKHSETAFVLRQGDQYLLRWFTPTTEVPLCGHATLATAHVLWEHHYEPRDRDIQFVTAANELLSVTRSKEMIVMDFPQKSITPTYLPEPLRDALRLDPLFVGCDDLRYLLEVEHERHIHELCPDFNRLRQYEKRVIVTAPSSSPAYDCVSRVFAPSVGVDEDPVTGSAHCYLAPYWGRKLNKQTIVGYQASSRPGIICCELHGDSRVFLKGTAKTVIKGDLLL